MGFGAIFTLVIAAIVVAVLGAFLPAADSALRRGKLHREGGNVEGGEGSGAGTARRDRLRPRHTRVGSEQRTRVIAHH